MPSLSNESIGVLAVTSDTDYACHIERELPSHGSFSVTTAATVGEAIEHLRSDRSIDCIVSDHDLPTVDGIAFLETVRVQAPDLPFVLFTSEGDESIASRAVSAGVTDYLIRERHGDQWRRLATLIENAVGHYRSRGDLIETEARARALLDAASDTIAIVRDGRYTYLNESGVELFGLATREEIYDEPIAETLEAADGHPSIETVAEMAATERGTTRLGALLTDVDGSTHPVEINATAVEWLDTPAVVLVIRDVSDRRASERRLRRFRRAVEAAGHSIYITDPEGIIEYVNPEFEETTGYSSEEAIGRTPRILKSGEQDDEYYEELWGTVLRGEIWEEEVVDRRKSGTLYHAHQTIAPIFDEEDDIEGFVAIQTDITEQKEREERLREYERAIEGANDFIAAIDADYRFLFANRQYRDYHGIDRDGLAGTRLDRALDTETWREVEAHVQRALQGDRVRYQMTRPRPGRPDRTFDIRYYPLADEETGEVRGVVGTMRDVTARRERERQLDVLSRVLRHNLQNDMNIIMGNAETIADEATDEVKERAERIASTGGDLLEVTEKQKQITELLSEPRVVRPYEITGSIRRSVDRLRERHPEANISLSLPESIEVDTIPEITRAIRELIENAIEHSDRPAPTVTVSADVRDETVAIEIRDDGPGIPEQERTILTDNDEIEPLYHGSGMGLWLVDWIVTHSAGELSFEENDPRGSVVRLSLPRTDPRASVEPIVTRR
jgi:PAS domain S-box-containing protein